MRNCCSKRRLEKPYRIVYRVEKEHVDALAPTLCDLPKAVQEGLALSPRSNKKRVEQSLGRFIVASPDVCHGKPTFRGTRVLVTDVLDQVAAGMAWESIIHEWHGSISAEAIGEAVQLAREALLRHADQFLLKSSSA